MAKDLMVDSPTSDDTVSRAAFRVMVGAVFSLLAGLASQVVIASIFGAGVEMDAYLTAIAIPLYFWAVLISGLTFVLIPAFIREKMTCEEDAWALVGTFYWLSTGVLTATAIVVSLAAPAVINIVAPDMGPAKADLAARMLSIVMFTLPLTGLGSFTADIQNTRNSFFWPSVSRAIGSLGNVGVLLVFYRIIGPLALAWGYLVAEMLKAAITTVPILRHGWTKLLPLNDRRVREVVRLVVPLMLFGILTRCTPIFERYFASGLPDGDLSYLGYAKKIANIVRTLIGEGLILAIFPAMARAYTRKGVEGLVETTAYGLRLTVAVALPAVMVLSALSVPLVAVLFERGAFTRATTLSVSLIIPVLLVGEVLFSIWDNIVVRAFYATKDTYTGPIVATVITVIYITLGRLAAQRWGYIGLAWVHTFHLGVGIIAISLLLVRKLKTGFPGTLIKSVLGYGAASLVAFGSAMLVLKLLPSLPALLQLVVVSIVAGTIYMVILYRLDRDITISILEMAGTRTLGLKLGLRHADSLEHIG